MQVLTDLLTGQKFSPKRKNQKFVSAKNRINYNNKKATDLRNSKAFIDKPFQINHKILMELVGPGETKEIPKQLLLEKGYNLSVMSHYENFNGRVSPTLYNFILIDLFDNKSSITIHRKS